jgi:hypothetical protein
MGDGEGFVIAADNVRLGVWRVGRGFSSGIVTSHGSMNAYAKNN